MAAELPRVKIISFGDALVGKSCIIKRFCESKFVGKHIPTIGVDYGVKTATVRGTEVRVNFFDLSGNPEYLQIRNEFYKDSHGGMLVFSMGDRSSFEHLDKWMKECMEYSQTNKLPLVLLGNKCEEKKAVSAEEAQKWGRERGIQFFEVSAGSGHNVRESFAALFDLAMDVVELGAGAGGAGAVKGK